MTGYDSAGRITSLDGQKTGEINKSYLSLVSYAPHGAITSLTLGNGLVEQTSFNNRLQPSQIKLGTSTSPASLWQLDYTYGVSVNNVLDLTKNNGNVERQSISAPKSAGGSLLLTQSYIYDALNRLSTAAETLNSVQQWQQSYGYDRFGNRWVSGFIPNPQQTPQSLSAFDAMTNRIKPSVMPGFSYDAAGNVTSDPQTPASGILYDAENRQLSYTKTGVGTTSYFYDGDGRRVKKVVASTTTVFVYNVSGQLIAEYTSDPLPPPVSGSGTSYLTTDTLGSTRVVTKSDGSVKARYDYLPFGEEIASSIGGRSGVTGYGGADSTKQKFTSKERDTESGLDYFLARYCSSAQGRFTSSDPIFFQKEMVRDPQRFNLYAYVRNNPLKFIDPKGEAIELLGNDEQRKVIINALCQGVGEQAGSYLYEKSEMDKKTGKVRYFVGIYTNGPDGKGQAFASINPVASALNNIISNWRVAAISLAQNGEVVKGFGETEKYRVGPIGVTSPGVTFSADYGSKTYLLDPRVFYGNLPGATMEDNSPSPVDISITLMHELGHVENNWRIANGPSDKAAMELENSSRQIRNPAGPRRIKHDNESSPHIDRIIPTLHWNN